jgi:uncharacterized protein (DUF1501 family)
MHFIQPQLQSRRAFLRRAGQLAFTGAALPTAINLAAMGEAAAFNASDYKALVCVFLYGGNDYANTVIPYDDPNYNLYHSIRGGNAGQAAGGIALAKTNLTSTLLSGSINSAIGQSGLQYALHPSMTGLHALHTSTNPLDNVAVMLNCGPLIVPMTKAQYNARVLATPPKLFSHNDQQSIWQSSSPEGSTIGWGGNIGDLAMSSNTNSLFTCISITGNAVFLAGDSALSYQVGTGGAVRIDSMGSSQYGFNAVSSAIRNLSTNTSRVHLLENEYNKITKRAVDAEGAITAAIASTAATNNVFPAPFNNFPADNSLASQLRMVARLIAARDHSQMGNKRQVFMVSLGGFDLHDNLIDGHTRNMGRVSSAMKAFHDTMVALGVGDKVTAFTASEFGRTLSSNGDGTDHGWGGHQFIVGGAVNKGFYGYAPPVSVSSTTAPADQWHVGQGRLLPTTSVDQMAGTLAKWFGVSDTELIGTAGQSYRDALLPNLHNFGGTSGGVNYPTDMGFMKP